MYLLNTKLDYVTPLLQILLGASHLGLPGLANENTRHPVPFQFQINNEYGFSVLGTNYTYINTKHT